MSKEYIQLHFADLSAEQSSILIAQLSEIGFEGFEEMEEGLKAFCSAASFDEAMVEKLAMDQGATYTRSTIAETNWNAVWESNFEPVLVNDFVGIRAEFHEQMRGVKHEIVVTPKMSFGTGHHATTHMMIAAMEQIDFMNKSVLDFGTGTGVLAILAMKLGAKQIVAIDNDEWSITNATENFGRNNCVGIELRRADDASVDRSFDVILANINKNVILDNLGLLVGQLRPGGVLLLSGLLVEDENDIFRKKDEYSLQLIQTFQKANWLCIKMSRQPGPLSVLI